MSNIASKKLHYFRYISFFLTKLMYICSEIIFDRMEKLFEIIILEEVLEFLKGLHKKHSEKILYNIRKSQVEPDSELFKKLNNEIW
ncbi:hypothetical protein [Pedobacter segetis]|uniref:hypothetical protein n=1 Tax=Pedobacter segetis TaxID=2793069 RepID=UPI001F379E59|nr:hypothetical protein [Pedobacter segetis]